MDQVAGAVTDAVARDGTVTGVGVNGGAALPQTRITSHASLIIQFL